MKQQILNFALSSSIFITPPAYCMIEEPQKGILCRLPAEMQKTVLKELGGRNISSVICVSKDYYKFIKSFTKEIDLNISYRNSVNYFKMVEFSIHMVGDEGKNKKLTFLENVIFGTSQEKNNCKSDCFTTLGWERSKKIIFFPSRSKLEFLVKGESENLKNLSLPYKGYHSFNANSGSHPPVVSEIVNGSVFNLKIQIYKNPIMGEDIHNIHANYTLCNAQEEEKFRRKDWVRED